MSRAKTNWGYDCCNPVPHADYTNPKTPLIYLRHIGADCYGYEEPLSLIELQERKLRKFATQS